MKIYDISQELLSSAVYDGDPAPTTQLVKSIDGGEVYYRQANMTPETTAAATNGDPDNGNE